MQRRRQRFVHVSDPDRLATWQTNTVSAIQEGDGPFGLGTRLREIHRTPGGKEVESVVEVSDYQPDRTLGLRVVEGTPIHVHLTIAARSPSRQAVVPCSCSAATDGRHDSMSKRTCSTVRFARTTNPGFVTP
jgi:hypothetical protein